MLNDKQKYVAFDIDGNTIVSASPGSGKTRTLVARANKKADTLPNHKIIGLITYTNAAADEISSRLLINGNDAFIGTIHKFCLSYILKPFGWLYGWQRPRIVTFLELTKFFEIHNDLDLGINKFDELNKIKRKPNGDLDLEVAWENSVSLEYVADLYFKYLDNINAIDFNEIIFRSYRIICENDFVAKSIASKFYEILVDEFQDTSFYQFEILKRINIAGDCTFFLVGDERQKIYSFAGALENSFQLASEAFGSNIYLLDSTYRSTNNIVRGYSSLFPGHPKLHNLSQYKDEDIAIHTYEINNQTRSKLIKSLVERYINAGIDLVNIAVLSVSWFDALPVSKYLGQYYNVTGIGALPHKNISNTTFSLLRLLTKYQFSNSISILRAIRRNIELHDLENNLNLSIEQTTRCLNLLITEFLNINKEVKLLEGISQIKKIFDAVFKVHHTSFDELESILDPVEISQWTLRKYLETLSGLNGIQITTIHQSKGLEYDAVILVNINENKIPFQRCIDNNKWVYEPLTEENLEAGRCLLYVAMSRARIKLDILHTFKPSLFINIIER